MFKIKIMKDGPYIVNGLQLIVQKKSVLNKDNILEEVETNRFDSKKEYHLCRCGASAEKPFCDGSHVSAKFNGDEVSDRRGYIDRSEMYTGERVQLLDDGRCAFARFCHRKNGDVWTLTQNASNATDVNEVIKGASACPAGRLTAVLNGKIMYDPAQDEVAIFQDPLKKVSAGVNVKGDFLVESSDGTFYEKRDRISLCRCGHSRNKPFCDATHVKINFNDEHI